MNFTYALSSFLNSIKSVPTPRGFTSREIVNRAIEFSYPPRIPYCMFSHPTKGDIFDYWVFGIYFYIVDSSSPESYQ